MAKKQLESNASLSTGGVTTNYSGSFSGDFTGDLYGNATTATSLQNPFTITVLGDARGSFATAGQSTSLRLTVSKSANADHANYADTAGEVVNAQYAATAGEASHAISADTSNTATLAKTANQADKAIEAGHASRADLATSAETADVAHHAEEADLAKEAEHAKTADFAKQLADDGVPIRAAKFAENANKATFALSDCLGRQFVQYYALKSELEKFKDMITIHEGKHIFLTREEKITQATVRGRAIGSGVVNGNTLELFIESIAGCGCAGHREEDCCNGGCGSIYCDIVFDDFPNIPEADTTKAYVDLDQKLHLWDQNNRTWVTLTATIDEETQRIIDGLLEEIKNLTDAFDKKLSNVVTIDGNQLIEGKKTYSKLIESPIADINIDPARTVATIHNVRDVRDQLRAETHMGFHKLKDIIDEIISRVDGIEVGDIQIGYKDYTIPANQPEMVPRTIYINWLDKDKVYIPIDPETNLPFDDTRECVYIRSLVKSTTNVVTWTDKRTSIDPNLWVPWDIQENGKRNIVLDQGSQLKSYNSVGEKKNLIFLSQNDTVQTGTIETGYNIRAKDGRVTINGQQYLITDTDLQGYMPITGGTFTGSISVPELHTSTEDDRVFSSAVVHALIDEKIAEFNNNLNIHKYMPKAGGDFTGKITVPDSIDVTMCGDKDVLNAKDVKSLIQNNVENSKHLKLELLDLTPVCPDELDENILYAVPVELFNNDSEIKSIRVEPDDSNKNPEAGEGVIYGAHDVL